MTLYILAGDPERNGLGVTAGKKVGKSVRRNRIKRLIKENFRHFEKFIRTGFRFVFVVRVSRDDDIPGYYDILSEMKSLLTRAGVFDRQLWENSQGGA